MAKTKDKVPSDERLAQWQIWAIRLSHHVLSNKLLAARFNRSPNIVQLIREWRTYKDVISLSALSSQDKDQLWSFLEELSIVMLNDQAITAAAKANKCKVREAFVKKQGIPFVFGKSQQPALPERKQVNSKDATPEPANEETPKSEPATQPDVPEAAQNQTPEETQEQFNEQFHETKFTANTPVGPQPPPIPKNFKPQTKQKPASPPPPGYDANGYPTESPAEV